MSASFAWLYRFDLGFPCVGNPFSNLNRLSNQDRYCVREGRSLRICIFTEKVTKVRHVLQLFSPLYSDCSEIDRWTQRQTPVQQICPLGPEAPMTVFCHEDWILIQRNEVGMKAPFLRFQCGATKSRQGVFDASCAKSLQERTHGHQLRGWEDYKWGFGSLTDDRNHFWIGRFFFERL